jgi:predicted DNA-binding transcriptional regulator YafY
MYNQHKILRVFQLINLLKVKPGKSIRSLAKTLAIDNRTIYRYLDLLREIGFELEKDAYNRYFIPDESGATTFTLSPEELAVVKKLLLTAGKDHILKDSILKKLYMHSDIHFQSGQIVKAHLSSLVEKLGEAVAKGKQVVLKKYHSANTNTIDDRVVEPIHFTDNYQNLVAFEVASKQVKYFNIERITALEILPKAIQHADLHKTSKPDVFGFGESGQTHEVAIWLSLRAYVFLKEEYPLTIPYLKYDKKRDQYRLQVTVNNLAPVQRFVNGLEGEVSAVRFS